jgi:hypothetical protein
MGILEPEGLEVATIRNVIQTDGFPIRLQLQKLEGDPETVRSRRWTVSDIQRVQRNHATATATEHAMIML